MNGEKPLLEQIFPAEAKPAAEEKPFTLLELAKRGIEKYKAYRTAKEQEKITQHKKEVEELKKTLDELKTEKQYEEEKAGLVAQIEAAKRELDAKKLKEAVE